MGGSVCAGAEGDKVAGPESATLLGRDVRPLNVVAGASSIGEILTQARRRYLHAMAVLATSDVVIVVETRAAVEVNALRHPSVARGEAARPLCACRFPLLRFALYAKLCETTGGMPSD